MSFLLGDFSVMEFYDPMGLGGEFGVVGDHDDGLAGEVEFEEDLEDLFSGGGVEISGGFVGEENDGVIDDGAGDGDPLAFAAGELAGEVKEAMFQTEPGEDLAGMVFNIAGISEPGSDGGADEDGHGDVFLDGEFRQEMVELEDEAEGLVPQVVAVGIGGGKDIDIIENHGSLIGPVEGAEEVHEGALPAAGDADDGQEFSLFDLEVHAAEDGDLNHIQLIGLMQIRRLQ